MQIPPYLSDFAPTYSFCKNKNNQTKPPKVEKAFWSFSTESFFSLLSLFLSALFYIIYKYK